MTRPPLSVDQLDLEGIRARRILVVGPTDAGKTTLTRRLYNHWCTREKVLVLDTDVGQSDIGPPGSLGLATGNAPVEDLAQLRETALHFAGILSPSEDLAQFLWGVERLFRLALAARPLRLLVNTTGWIHGGAISLKMAKANLINPDLIMVLAPESTPLVRLLTRSSFPLMVLEPSDRAKTRNSEARRRFRHERTRAYFSRGKRTTLNMENLLVIGAIRELKNLENRIVGLLDGAFRTLGTAWITELHPEKPLARAWVRRLSKGEVRYIKAGPLVEPPEPPFRP